jgi:hypothetical protein
MRLGRKAAMAAVISLAIVGATAVQAQSVDRQFSNAVARILDSVKGEQEFLQELSASDYKQFVACAQKVMAAAPAARKQYVLAASDQGEMRQRFDEVALDNRAALKQQITRDCA